jgi:beta-glucanase (GH16 family)
LPSGERGFPKWHAANLGWPIKDSEWPDKGENDYMEMQLDGQRGAFFHILHGGSNGEEQIEFGAPNVDITQWFTVGFELIAGKSYKWLVNGKQVGDTVPAEKVPNYPQRIVLQLEDGGGQTEEANLQYDWVTAWALKAAA